MSLQHLCGASSLKALLEALRLIQQLHTGGAAVGAVARRQSDAVTGGASGQTELQQLAQRAMQVAETRDLIVQRVLERLKALRAKQLQQDSAMPGNKARPARVWPSSPTNAGADIAPKTERLPSEGKAEAAPTLLSLSACLTEALAKRDVNDLVSELQTSLIAAVDAALGLEPNSRKALPVRKKVRRRLLCARL